MFKNFNRGASTLLIIGSFVVLAIVIAGGVFIIDNIILKNSIPKSEEVAVDKNSLPSGNKNSDTVSVSLSPKDVYLKYKEEYEKMKTSVDYGLIVMKYGSSYAIEDYKKAEEQMKEMSSAQAGVMFQIGKKMNQSLNDITDIDQEIRGNRAMLLVTSMAVKNYRGGIGLIKEDGEWKIDHEVWSISKIYFDENGRPVVNLDFNWWFNDWPANRMPK